MFLPDYAFYYIENLPWYDKFNYDNNLLQINMSHDWILSMKNRDKQCLPA